MEFKTEHTISLFFDQLVDRHTEIFLMSEDGATFTATGKKKNSDDKFPLKSNEMLFSVLASTILRHKFHQMPINLPQIYYYHLPCEVKIDLQMVSYSKFELISFAKKLEKFLLDANVFVRKMDMPYFSLECNVKLEKIVNVG